MEDNLGSYRTRLFLRNLEFPDDYIKKMATEQGLYAQVVNLLQNYLKSISENKNKNETKFKFQGQSTRSQRWFDLDWI